MTKKLTLLLLASATLLYAGKGKIRVASDVQGAYIYVDGKKKAMTGEGFTSILLEEGEHEIMVEHSLDQQIGHYVWRKIKKIFIGENTSTKIKFKLINTEPILTKEGKYFQEKRKIKKLNDKKIGRWLNKDNVLIDNELKLMWQDEPYTKKEEKAYWSSSNYGKVLKYKYAKKYCDKLVLNGYKDWYLPEIEKLVHLYNYREELKNLTPHSYLSSSLREEKNIIEVERLNGEVINDYAVGYDTIPLDSDVPSYVRCVRDF